MVGWSRRAREEAERQKQHAKWLKSLTNEQYAAYKEQVRKEQKAVLFWGCLIEGILGLILLYNFIRGPEKICAQYGPERLVDDYTSTGAYVGKRPVRDCVKWIPNPQRRW